MEVRKGLRNAVISAGVSGWFVLALFGTPSLIAGGLWLLGVPLDWGSWKTYVGIMSLTGAMVLANK